MPIGKHLAVVFDCKDPKQLSYFWQRMLGGEIDPRNLTSEWVTLANIPGMGNMGFQKVPEFKMAKNRLHLDIDVESIDVSVNESVDLGAKKVGELVEESTNFFQVMTDPEGNEFCFILRKNK